MPDRERSAPRDAARFDELLGSDGQPRAHWQPLCAALAGAEPESVRARLAAVEREVYDSGLTYTIYAAPLERERPWPLDALPLIIPAHEWADIERAVRQRARLLNTVLADLYGPQRLLHSGAIPPALILGHSGFQRPACGVPHPGGVALFSYAADLARAPDGRWWVMADRTQAPSGAGYALSNRFTISRVLPQAFQAQQVQRLAGFFATLRAALLELAPQGDGSPLTVLLTPGVYTETYAEHALLARYLGIMLVEGHDLTVRHGKLWLKTVTGLRRVHAVLRRQDDDYCDPLELRADSALGVPGLVACARQGTVFIANAIGAGILESGALLGFLPGLAQQVLGEPLQMPSVATWWLGEPAALRDAMAQIDQLVFKSVEPQVRAAPIFGRDLDAAGRRALKARIARQPQAWIAQEWVRLSQAPVFEPGAPGLMASRAVGLRVFAVAAGGDWAVMPGGLARLATEHDPRILSMQQGGISKDTWVLSETPGASTLSLLRPTVGSADLVRSGAGGLTSRAAEHLFWLGRYIERAEDTARLLRVALARFGLPEAHDPAAQQPLQELAQATGLLPEDTDQPVLAGLLAAMADPGQPGGLRVVLEDVQRVAVHLRERVSLDHWRAIQRVIQQAGLSPNLDLARALPVLDQVLTSLVTLVGFTLDGMTRDIGWRFVSLGRRVERLQAVCRALEVALSEAGQGSGPDWLLELFDSSLTYRARYLGSAEWLPVLDLLIRDESNPRSVAFQRAGLAAVRARLEGVFEPAVVAAIWPAILADESLWADLGELADIPAVRAGLAALANAAAALSDQLSLKVFTHTEDGTRPSFAA